MKLGKFVLSLLVFMFSGALMAQKNSFDAGVHYAWYPASILFNETPAFSGNKVVSDAFNPSYGFRYMHTSRKLGVGVEVFYEPLRFNTPGIETRDDQNNTMRNYYQQRVDFISFGVPLVWKFGEVYKSSYFYAGLSPRYWQLLGNVAAVRDSSGNEFESRDSFGLVYGDESQFGYSLSLGFRWKWNDSYRNPGWALGVKGRFDHRFFTSSANSSTKYVLGLNVSLAYVF